jgi:Fe-S cluster assembly iron-binding protein IscA
MTQEQSAQPPVTLSESAADVLKTVAENAEVGADQAVIRFSIQQQEEQISHHIALEAAPADTDVVFEQHGLTLVVAEEQVPFVNGSHIEYTATGDQPQLLVSNPNLGTA